MSEIICPNCGHDIGAECHIKLDSIERSCHCSYQAREVAEMLIGNLQTRLDIAVEALKDDVKIFDALDKNRVIGGIVLSRARTTRIKETLKKLEG